jgi:hypothetical protein
MNITNTFNQLTEEELDRLRPFWPSIYPVLYWELCNWAPKRVVYDNARMGEVHEKLNKLKEDPATALSHTVGLFSKFPKYDGVLTSELYDEKTLTELLMIFFAFDTACGDVMIKGRGPCMSKAYQNKHRKTLLENIYWRHDGWWNCFFGPVEDTEALDVMKTYNPKKDDYPEYCRASLVYAYRLVEAGRVEEAAKLIRKRSRHLQWRAFKWYMKDKIPSYLRYSLPIKLFYSFCGSQNYYIRYQMNMNMLLYRIRPKKKKRILKKLMRSNAMGKHMIYNFFDRFFTQQARYFSLPHRPQHILRLIEIRADLYEITKDESLVVECKTLISDIWRAFNDKYYSTNHGEMYYFMVCEFFMTLYYFLQKVYGFDLKAHAKEMEQKSKEALEAQVNDSNRRAVPAGKPSGTQGSRTKSSRSKRKGRK